MRVKLWQGLGRNPEGRRGSLKRWAEEEESKKTTATVELHQRFSLHLPCIFSGSSWCSSLVPQLLHSLAYALSPLPLESSSCESNGVTKPLILLTHVHFSTRPVMGTHLGGEHSCHWDSFSPQAHGFFCNTLAQWSCLASGTTGE